MDPGSSREINVCETDLGTIHKQQVPALRKVACADSHQEVIHMVTDVSLFTAVQLVAA